MDISSSAINVAAVAVLMATWWITEAIPIPATALLPIALFPVLGVMKAAEATTQYANHLIFLFLGGFFIAVTMEKWRLHTRIALHTIKLIGVGPSRIILGFMLATAFLSMWISNTATAMMMLPIAMAVVNQATDFIKKNNIENIDTRPSHFRFGTALMLGIAYAASIGGVATIIGTPPNTIMVGFIEKAYDQQISFASWMAIGLPLAVLMLILTWAYLVKIALPPEIKELPGGREVLVRELKNLGPLSKAEKLILIVFCFVAFSWIGRGFIHIEALKFVHDSTIAVIGALLLFIIPINFKKGGFLLDWPTAVKVPWDVILLFGGGLALANGFQISGLDQWIGDQLKILQGAPLLVLVGIIVFVTIFLTEITSNTATSAMMIPIMGSIALAMAIHPYGPIFAAGIAASYAFMLPVATPPNAVIFGSKYVTIPKMAKVGFILNLAGCILITLLILYLVPLIWDIDLHFLPDWLR
ncbi:MAG: DASS family sodium-coupled anion symporter [Calditrichaceae bacterium]|nr:DASS family sodium-coupled anion symporter [Calditrichaceae bacterium]